jgi:RNA polymerase sigma-70 factor (ECF subfamily)
MGKRRRRIIQAASESTANVDDSARRDREAMRRARVNPAAFSEIYERYVDAIYRYCFHRTHDHDLAIDLTQQTFLRALQAVPRFVLDESGTVRSWLFAIAHNTVIDAYRTARPVDTLHQPRHEGSLEASEPSPAEQTILNDRRRELQAAIAKLTPIQQKIITLRLAGLTAPEIAERLDMKLPAVKSAQYRAYRLLRDELADWHPADDGGGE